MTFGGGGAPATVLCGYFRFDPASRHPLIGALPPFIHVRDADDESTASLCLVGIGPGAYRRADAREAGPEPATAQGTPTM